MSDLSLAQKRRLFGRGFCTSQEKWLGAGEGVFCSPLSWLPSSRPSLITSLRSRSAAAKTHTTALTGQSPSPASGRRGDGDAPSREPSTTNTGHPSSPEPSTKQPSSPCEDKDKDKKEVCSWVNGCSLGCRVMGFRVGVWSGGEKWELTRNECFFPVFVINFFLQLQIL